MAPTQVQLITRRVLMSSIEEGSYQSARTKFVSATRIHSARAPGCRRTVARKCQPQRVDGGAHRQIPPDGRLLL